SSSRPSAVGTTPSSADRSATPKTRVATSGVAAAISGAFSTPAAVSTIGSNRFPGRSPATRWTSPGDSAFGTTTPSTTGQQAARPSTSAARMPGSPGPLTRTYTGQAGLTDRSTSTTACRAAALP